MITILYRRNNQSIYHSFYPILTSKYRKEFRFTTILDECLSGRDTNKFLIVAGIFKGKYAEKTENVGLIERLKTIYKKVVFWDESDGADSLHSELLEVVDLYFKKQILRNKKTYLKPAYGEQQFSDFYHKENDITDDVERIREPVGDEALLEKLHFLWNIGASVYPFSRGKRRVFNMINDHIEINGLNYLYKWTLGSTKTVKRGKRKRLIQARFGYGAYPNSIGFQRKLLLELVQNRPKYLTGRVPKSEYQQELSQVSAVLSPYGFGEICHRDFEAILGGAVIVKPNMSHIETFPNIYLPNETYLPIEWRGEGLEEVEDSLNDEELMNKISSSGLSLYLEMMNKTEGEVLRLIELIQAC